MPNCRRYHDHSLVTFLGATKACDRIHVGFTITALSTGARTMRQAALADQGQRCAVPIPRGHVRRPSCPLTLTRQQRMPPVVSPLGPARGARASHRHGPPQWSGSSQCMPDAAMAAEVHVAVDSAPDAGATPQLGHLMHTAVAVARAPVAPAASTTSIPAGWPVPSVPVPSPAAVEKTLPRGVPKSRGRGFFSRLLTHLDPLRLHAVSGALHLVLSTGAVIHILGHTLVFGVNPYPLHDLIIPTLFATSLVMNCTGVQMAVTHRRGELQTVGHALDSRARQRLCTWVQGQQVLLTAHSAPLPRLPPW